MNSTKKLRLDSSQFFDTASHATESVATGNTVYVQKDSIEENESRIHMRFWMTSLNTPIEYVYLHSERVFVLYGVNIPYRPKTPVKRKFEGFTGVLF